MTSFVRGVIRGTVAWIAGYLLTLGVLVAGLVESANGAARTFLEAHTIVVGAGTDPATMVIVPALVLGGLGYRIGRGIGSGVLGRLRASAGSLLGGRSSHTRAAVKGGVYLAVSYAVVAAIAAAVVGVEIGEMAVSSLLVALIVGVPAVVAGARL